MDKAYREETIQSIANAIKLKTGNFSHAYKVSEFAPAVCAIECSKKECSSKALPLMTGLQK